MGVIHVIGPVGETLDDPAVHALTVVATQLGARLGMVRTLADTRLQARTDALTGLLNRRSFESEVRGCLEQGGNHCVLLADLDHFKRLNDTHGHSVGDRALTVFSSVMQANLRPQDVVGRHGGEEFAVMLDDCSLDEARQVLARLRAALVEEIGKAGLPPFTVSMGLSRWGRDGSDLPTLLEVADQALYQAKESGRDRVVVAGLGPEEPLVAA